MDAVRRIGARIHARKKGLIVHEVAGDGTLLALGRHLGSHPVETSLHYRHVVVKNEYDVLDAVHLRAPKELPRLGHRLHVLRAARCATRVLQNVVATSIHDQNLGLGWGGGVVLIDDGGHLRSGHGAIPVVCAREAPELLDDLATSGRKVRVADDEHLLGCNLTPLATARRPRGPSRAAVASTRSAAGTPSLSAGAGARSTGSDASRARTSGTGGVTAIGSATYSAPIAADSAAGIASAGTGARSTGSCDCCSAGAAATYPAARSSGAAACRAARRATGTGPARSRRTASLEPERNDSKY
jgi:hypothetical protein